MTRLVLATRNEHKVHELRAILAEATVTGHHDVHVGVGRRVLRVVEVHDRQALDDTDAHRSHRPGQGLRILLDQTLGSSILDRVDALLVTSTVVFLYTLWIR